MPVATSSNRSGPRSPGTLSLRLLATIAVALGFALTCAPAAPASGVAPVCSAGLDSEPDPSGAYPAEAGEGTQGSFSCTDADDDALAIAVTAQPAHGALSALTQHGFPTSSAYGSFRYTPTPGYLGPDVVRLDVGDGTNDVIVEFDVVVIEPVDDPPQCYAYLAAAPGGVFNQAEAGEANPGYISCTDDERQDVSFSLGEAPGHGTLGAIVEDPLSGMFGSDSASYTYTPAADHRGADVFKIQASDGTNDTLVAVAVDVIEPVNDPPQCYGHMGGGLMGAPGGPPEAGEPSPGSVSCSDDERQDLSFSVGQAPAHGTITALTDMSAGIPGMEFATFTYTPAADYTGPDSFSLKVGDGANDTIVAFDVTVVAAVDDAPQCFAFMGQPGPGGMVAEAGEQSFGTVSCSDDERQAMTFSVSDPPAHGTLSAITGPNGGGLGNAFASFTYVAAADYRGPDAFSIKVSDGTNDTIVQIGVTVVEAVNDSPRCLPGPVTVRQPNSVDILPFCFDPERADLTFEVTGAPAHGQLTPIAGGFRYTPAADFNGSDELRYKASDGNSNSAEVTVPIVVQAADPLLLSPQVDTPEVGAQHTVLASAYTAGGAAQVGKRVRWSIAGNAAAIGGDALTNASGQVEISWTRAAEGTDTLTAYVDTDDDGTRDAGEAQETATAYWRAQRDVDPPSAGQPTVNGDPVAVVIGTQIDPASPDERYFTISRSQTSSAGILPCPGAGPDSRAVDLPITLPIDPGAASTVQAGSVRLLLVDPATGDTSSPLMPPGPVVPTVSGNDYRFVLTCLRTGDLYVRYTLQEGAATQTYTVPVGGLTLIDPQGVVYDKAQYDVRIAAGDTPAAARASAAITGATAVLQRKVLGVFETLLSGDPGISPHVNPQITGADGRFQWDVSAGTYRVVVSKSGYDTVTSEGYVIPPPKLDAHIAMTRTAVATPPPPPPPAETTTTTPTTTTPAPPAPLTPRPAAIFAVSFATSPTSLRVSRAGVFSYAISATPAKGGRLGLKSTRKLRIGLLKRVMTLAPQAFTAPSTGKLKVRFKLSGKNLAALKRVKSLRFGVTATLGARTFRSTLTLRAPKAT